MLKIVFTRKADKFLQKLIKKNPKASKLITDKIDKLVINPNSLTSKRLVNTPYYRARAENYRIIYRYDKVNLFIVEINKREVVYRNI